MAPTEGSGKSLFFAFRDDRLLIHESPAVSLPELGAFDELGLSHSSVHFLGSLGEQPCFAVDLEEDQPLPEGMALTGLRREPASRSAAGNTQTPSTPRRSGTTKRR